ncbi:MAG TPA: tyrosine-type recombinase/integrase [Terriglobales bacterium]
MFPLRRALSPRENRSEATRGGHLSPASPTGSGDRRQIPLSREACRLHPVSSQRLFAAEGDWMFASPVTLGRLPMSYLHVWKCFTEPAQKAGIGKLSTHTMWHTYRSWLDPAGTPIAILQKAHAAFGSSHNDEYLLRCGHG